VQTHKLEDIDVDAARARLEGVAHRTPVFQARTIDERLGARVFLKAENMQRVGAFKFRGAYNHVSALSRERLARGVVASSSGNHAQALALAASLCGSRATILMPSDAPASKRAATLAYGAEVVSFDRYRDDREALTAELATQRGLSIVHAYDDPYIIAGAGTTAAELLEDRGELDLLVVCTGGGGLLAGCALAAKARFPDIRIIGVEPEASDDWRRSLRAGERVTVTVGKTIADGQQLQRPGELNFRVAQPLLEDIVTVSDAEIIAAMTLLFERCKLVCEPSGASALAALLAGHIDVRGQRVGVTLSGGNIDTARFVEIVGRS
jgi:threo-3-hydroxy-L-aspartate ammonia-lyase